MKRLLMVRLVVTAIGVVVWGYGQRVDDKQIRLVGIALLAIALLLRFAPKAWFGDE